MRNEDRKDDENRAFMSIRVPDLHWFTEKRFGELMAMLDRNRDAADEIAFFLCTGIHAVLPLETVVKCASTLRDRIRRARAAGYRAGINFLATLGHVDEYADQALQGDYTRITGPDGVAAKVSFCPNDERFREYIVAAYRAMAEAEPDFIWIDDDMRMSNHHPVAYGCFCPDCIDRFNRECGVSRDRETLVRAFDSGTEAEKKKLRTAWLEHNSRTVERTLSLIEETVHGMDSRIELGLMTPEHFYEGNNIDRWAAVLSGRGGVPVRWRPGGGFYSDATPGEMIMKSHSLGRQTALLPDSVLNVQSEIENFPYQPLRKSLTVSVAEPAVYMAAGCSGAAYNILNMVEEPVGNFEPLLRALAAKRPFYDRLREALTPGRPVGVYPAWNKKAMASCRLKEGKWLGGSDCPRDINAASELLGLGFPAAYSPEHADVTLLAGDIPTAYEPDELEKMFSGSVYLDGRALLHLQEAGLGDLAGFRISGWNEYDCAEVLTNDPLNGDSAGTVRDCIQSFWGNPCAVLSPLDESARVLGRKTIRFRGAPEFPCMGIYENRLGGRVAVAGYAPWTFLQSPAKSRQLKRLLRWLSRDVLTGYVSSYHKISLWARKDAAGKIALAMLNAANDTAEGVEIMVATDRKEARLLDMECRQTGLQAAGRDGACARFTLPPIAPWRVVLLTL